MSQSEDKPKEVIPIKEHLERALACIQAGVYSAAEFEIEEALKERRESMNLVLDELDEMLHSCELDGEEDGEFANQLRIAIQILKENHNE